MKLFKAATISILVLFAALMVCIFAWTWIYGPVFLSLEGRGQQGDFFGGHLSALFGCLTLLVVLYFGWRQREDDREARTREGFLAGLDLIAQYDLKSPGCEQAMRILDYYSKIALEDGKEEWLWMLNVVITKDIRKNLEELRDQKKEIYIHAQDVHKKIHQVFERYHKKKKGII
jgi:uncharacterized membrane protein